MWEEMWLNPPLLTWKETLQEMMCKLDVVMHRLIDGYGLEVHPDTTGCGKFNFT